MSLSHLVSETLNLFIKKYCNLRFKETCLFHQCAVARITQRLYRGFVIKLWKTANLEIKKYIQLTAWIELKSAVSPMAVENDILMGSYGNEAVKRRHLLWQCLEILDPIAFDTFF